MTDNILGDRMKFCNTIWYPVTLLGGLCRRLIYTATPTLFHALKPPIVHEQRPNILKVHGVEVLANLKTEAETNYLINHDQKNSFAISALDFKIF